MTRKDIEEMRKQKFYQYLQVAGFHKEAEEWFTHHHEAELKEVREEICRNHLEALEDALNDPDIYGAINGMAHGLRTFLSTTTPDKQTEV